MERVLNSLFLSALMSKLEVRERDGEAQLDPGLSPLSLPLPIRPQDEVPGAQWGGRKGPTTRLRKVKRQNEVPNRFGNEK